MIREGTTVRLTEEATLQRNRDWYAQHCEERKEKVKEWQQQNPGKVCAIQKKSRENNPEKVKARAQKSSRKGGKYYEYKKNYNATGLQGDRNRIRNKHRHQYQRFKHIIAPTSQIHHEWIPNTADFRGAALVETDQHQYGVVNPIVILEGEITLLTEAEIRGAF
jgi:CTP synthase (UTP-ammonia lyase)